MKLLFSALLLFAGLAASAAPVDHRPAKPNIVIILADDHRPDGLHALGKATRPSVS